MAQGTAKGVVRLYDEDGNPVSVIVIGGEYRLNTQDTDTRRVLEEILLELQEIRRVVAKE